MENKQVKSKLSEQRETNILLKKKIKDMELALASKTHQNEKLLNQQSTIKELNLSLKARLTVKEGYHSKLNREK